jgi:anti-anti-sigma factor
MFSAEWSTGGIRGQAIVALHGELDVVDAASLAAALVAAVAREPVIIADLAGLEFIDSSGAAALVLARKQARRAGGDLVSVGYTAPLRPCARRIMKTSAWTRAPPVTPGSWPPSAAETDTICGATLVF